MTNVANPAPVTMLEHALFYASRGWPVFRLRPCDKTPLPGSSGFKDATTDQETIISWWTTMPDANIGIATGECGFFTVDVDPRNGGDSDLDELLATHGKFPNTLEVITGGGGNHYHFKVPEGSRISGTRLSPGIDIKGFGGYIVAPPSIHPGTKAPYEWEASSDPMDGEELAEAPQWLLDRLAKTTSELSPPMGQVGAIIPRDQVLEIESALDFLSPEDYDLWIKVGMALNSSGAGRQAYGLWTNWSRGSEKFEESAQQKKWRSFGNNSGLNIESIFAWASEAGWVNPMDARKRQFQEINQELLDQANGRGPTYEVVDRPGIIDRTIPVSALASISDWMEQQLQYRQPYAVTHAVLSFASAMASRHYVSPLGDPAHTYLGIVTQSVGSTRTIKKLLHRLIAESGNQQMIRGSRIVSPQVLYKKLLRNPSTHWVADDYGQMVTFAKRQPSGLLESALNSISDAYAADAIYIDQEVDPQSLRNTEDCTIYQPALSILSIISDNQLGAVTKRSEIGRGAVEQMFCVCCPEPEPQEFQSIKTLPQTAISVIKQLREPRGRGNLAAVVAGLQPTKATEVTFPHEVLEALAEADKQIRELVKKNRYLTPIGMGAQQTLRRLLVALSAWNNPINPAASVDLVQWLSGYIFDHLAIFIERIETASEDGKADVYERVLEIVQESGSEGITQREIVRRCRPFRGLTEEQRLELIARMTLDGLIFEKKAGRTTVFIDRKYIREAS